MNKRINELIKEADRRCNETRGVYDEILAELIVRECARLAMNQRLSTNPDDYDEMKPYRQGCDDMASNISGLIRRTFGVEE